MTYGLAPQGIFATVQGEGVLLGTPMVFVRFAGCPVGCPECDTDYTLAARTDLDGLVRRVVECDPTPARWVWLTGGEPTVYDIVPLVARLHAVGYRVALATAGINPVGLGAAPYYGGGGVDFLSVSPHRVDDSWVLRRGDQLNVVPGLNGLRLEDFEGVDVSGFAHRFVTPPWYGPGGRAEWVAECREWVERHPDWRLGIQAHRYWGVP
jgi:7-carboxy-7-deazaguanine synthase